MLKPITRRAALLLLTLSAVLTVGPAFAGRTAPPRPLVILYPIRLDTGAKVISTGPSPEAELTVRAARIVCERLEDSNAVTAIVFTPESPLFQRAALEAKVDMGRRRELTSDEQVAVSKTAGAVYAVSVSTQPVPDGVGSFEILLSGINVETKKVWNDRSKFMAAGATQEKSGDANAVAGTPASVAEAESSLLTAANTLTLRMLSGPLGDYGRVAPPANLLPPTTPKTVADRTPTTENAEAEAAQAAYEQADVLITQGDSRGAIVLLRRAVSQSPLNGKLRLLLVKAYVGAQRPNDAAAEARRALQITPPENEAERIEITRLIADTFAAAGDRASARNAYEQVIATKSDANWARLSLAGIYLADGQADRAAEQYRAILKTEPGNRDAAVGIVRHLAAKGDFKAALSELGPDDEAAATPGQRAARHAAATVLFDEHAPRIATLMMQNRQAWESKTLSREAFYKATASHQSRINDLLAMLNAAPPEKTDAASTKAHAKRVHAATLLAQAATSLVNYLETGNADSGSQATLWLNEFRKELAQAQGQ